MDNGIITIDSSEDETSPGKVKKCIDKDIIMLEEENISHNKRKSISDTEDNRKFSPKRIKLINLQESKGDVIKNEIDTRESSSKLESSTKNINTSKNPSTSAQAVTNDEFEKFLAACKSSEYDKKYKDAVMKKIPNIINKFNDADENFITSPSFKKILVENTEKIVQNPTNTIIIFNDVFRELESKKKRSSNLSEREEIHLRKLKHTLKKVYIEIKRLENEEVDFEADNNSSYIMLQRYRERLCFIQQKICCYTKENYYAGRYLYRNLDFNASKYTEINRAIDKLYNKTKQFPSFYDIYNCIKKCANNNNIELNEDELNYESKMAFQAVGDIIQRRRKSELHESLSYFLDGSDNDPAENDPEFDAVLRTRQQENNQRIDEVIKKFSDVQERGYEERELSTDSDDSHYKSEDSDT